LSSPFLTFANDLIQEAELILKVEPTFPTQPYSGQILEGWVKLKFDVSELGNVTNIVVLDSLPNRIFNRSAKKALAKWKYSAKVINDKSVVSKGLVTTINFKLVE